MTDPVKKIGDAVLAREVIEKFARGEDCAEYIDEEKLGLGSSESGRSEPEDLLCHVFLDGLDDDSFAVVEPGEKSKLQTAGFAPEFIAELAGPDGRRALRERAKWLADHIVAPWYRPNLPAHERQKMVDELWDYGRDAAPALPHLKRMFQEGELKVDSAVAAIEDVETLLQDLNDKNPSVRLLACRALEFAGRGDPRVVPALMEKIKTDPQLRENAIISLWHHSEGAKVELPLLAVYHDSKITHAIRRIIIEILLSIADCPPESLSIFEDYLERDDVGLGTKEAVAIKLSQRGRLALPVLFKVLKMEGHSEVGADRVVDAIKKISLKAEDIKPLMEAVEKAYKKNDLEKPWELTRALVEVGAEAALPLVQVLNEHEGGGWDVALEAFHELGKRGGTAAEELYNIARNLQKKLEKGKLYRFIYVLSDLGEEAVLLKGLKDSSMNVLFLEVLGYMGEKAKGTLPHILPLVTATNPELRLQAIRALSNIAPEDSRVLLPVTLALKDPDQQVRSAAVFALDTMAGVNPSVHLALPYLTDLRNNVDELELLRHKAGLVIENIEDQTL